MKIACPSCGAKLKAPSTAIGKKARCKGCGETFRVTEACHREALEDSVALWIGGEDDKSDRRVRRPASDPLLHMYEEAKRRDAEKRKQSTSGETEAANTTPE